MARNKKVIITCPVTGAIHTPSMSKHLPVTAEQIADQAIAAAKAGAAILHLHARDPQNGKPSQDPELFRPFLSKIRAQTDVSKPRAMQQSNSCWGRLYSAASSRGFTPRATPLISNSSEAPPSEPQ